MCLFSIKDVVSFSDHQPRLDAWDKCSDLVHGEDPEGSGGEGGGRGDQDGEYMYIHGWFMSMYDKNHYNKKKKRKGKKQTRHGKFLFYSQIHQVRIIK